MDTSNALRVRARAVVEMSRPDQLLLVVGVYGLGTLVAVARGTALDRTAALAGLLALLPVAASVHFANEYADYETDALTTRTPFSGGSGALQRTDLPRRLALDAAVAALAVGGVAMAAVSAAGWLPATAAVLLVVIATFGWMYSLPPLALAWRGWGELDNALLGGLVLPLVGFAAQTGTVTVAAALACLPFTALVFVNLLATTWPDRQADAAVGKATLATRWSRGRLQATYLVGAKLALCSPLVLAGGVLPPVVAWASLLAVPPTLVGAALYTRRESPFPTVAAMVGMALAQGAAWGVVAVG